MTREVLVEYAKDPNDPEIVWYNLSLIVCLGSLNRKITTDTTECGGFEAGLQLSHPGRLAFQCEAGKWCDDQAYFYPVSGNVLR